MDDNYKKLLNLWKRSE